MFKRITREEYKRKVLTGSTEEQYKNTREKC